MFKFFKSVLIRILTLLMILFSVLTSSQVQAEVCLSDSSGNWSTANWSCGHVPTAADATSIGTVVTLDQNVAVEHLMIPTVGTLNAGNYTITVNGMIICSGAFNYGTSTVILTDANHILSGGTPGCTYYNLNMATLTAPRVIEILDITVNGSFISGTSISNQVSFINWDSSMNGVNTPVRSYYCASNGGMINIDCIPGGPPVLTNLTISNPTQTSLTLNWTDNCQDEDSFILGRATTPGGPYTETVIATGNKAGTGVSQSYNDTGVTCGMTYYYVVKTRLNPATDSTNSTEVNASTSACSPTTYTFSTTTAGIGTGNLTGSTANGTYPVGTTVVLNATANAGSTFAGWSPASCVTGMTLNADTTCTATFNVVPNYTLTLTKAGTGDGVITGGGVYPAGQPVTLTATAANGSTFAGWSPASCVTGMTLTADTSCTATFNVVPPNNYTLTLAKTGTGDGVVTGGGVYPAGQPVTLTATAANGSTFAGWSPASCVTGMTLNADTTCTATFNLTPTVPVTSSPSTPPLPDHLGLFVQIDGSGHGQVITDTGLSCQSSDCQTNEVGERKCDSQACTQVVKTTSYVTLTPHTDADSVFSSWGGHEDCVDGEVFMNSSKLCIAYFRRLYPLTITIQGAGLVQGFGGDQQPMGIDCGTECEATYSAGTTVYLQATPATGQEFLGWGGDCEGLRNPLAVEMTKEKTCEARFGVIAPPVVLVPPVVEPVPAVPTTPEPTPVVTKTEEPTPVVTQTEEPTPVVTQTEESTPVVTQTEEPTPVVTQTEEPTPVVTQTEEPTPVVTKPVAPTPVQPTTTTPSTSSVTGNVTQTLQTGFNESSTCPRTGDIDEVCNYGGQEVTDLQVQDSGIVSNGVLSTTLVSTGWVSNFTITETGELSGGIVTGYLKNHGLICDFDFKGMSIVGGKLCGIITNTSKVGGYIQDVTLLAGTKIIGGILKGTIKGDKNSPAVLEKVRVKTGSHLSGVTIGRGVILEKGVVVE